MTAMVGTERYHMYSGPALPVYHTRKVLPVSGHLFEELPAA